MSSMTVTFEAPEETVRAFDDVAASLSMSREEALQSLMENHLTYDKAFRASVQLGIEQADAGQLVDHSVIRTLLEDWEREASSEKDER